MTAVTTIDLDALMGELTGSVRLTDEFAIETRIAGADWPEDGLTMIGHKRLENIRDLIERAVHAGVAGDVIECGVWRGGACIFMRAVLESLGCRDRVVLWVADSFQGCPEGDEHHSFRILAVPESQVHANFQRFGMLDGQVRFLPGFFADSLPGPVEQLAVLRIDCDMYSSYRQVLEALYPKLSPGGFVILDDYYALAEAARAVNEYRTKHDITAAIHQVDAFAGYWRKEIE